MDSDTSLEELIFTSSVNPNADLTSSHNLLPGNLSRTVDGWNPANLTCLRPCLLDLIAITWRVESLNQVPSVFTSCAANYETKNCEDIWRYITWLINIVYIYNMAICRFPTCPKYQTKPPSTGCKVWFLLVLMVDLSSFWKHQRQGQPLSPQSQGFSEGFLNDLGHHFRHTCFYFSGCCLTTLFKSHQWVPWFVLTKDPMDLK